MIRRKKHLKPFRIMAILLCLCMILPLAGGMETATTVHAEDDIFVGGATDSEIIVEGSRVADPDTTDSYQEALLSDENGSRYAGRVWTDKTVFAYDADGGNGGTENNQIVLDMATDGYDGNVSFNADFLHVYSALASSQKVNEYPPTPIDLVIVFDMSGSMGQDTRFGIDSASTSNLEHKTEGDTKKDENGNLYEWPEDGVSMQDRIQNSRIQATLTAINKTIDGLMRQNLQNRVAVCAYGANATVLMPLAHYRGKDKDKDGTTDYLIVGGMETLYHPSDLQVKDIDGVPEWRWMNNRDTCYTVVVNAKKNTNTTSGFNSEKNDDKYWQPVHRTVSNNIDGGGGTDGKVKAFPGVAIQGEGNLRVSARAFKDKSDAVVNIGHQYLNPTDVKNDDKNKLMANMRDTVQLSADEYIGYFTNTQGGIYLAYEQLAKDDATTYSEQLSTGKEATVARIPAAIIMSDGGANFAFNEMGKQQKWGERFGGVPQASSKWDPTQPEGSPVGDSNALAKWYFIDQDNTDTSQNDLVSDKGVDRQHRLGNAENLGDEWYKVYLPSKENLTIGEDQYGRGLPSMYNVGADYYRDGTLSSQPLWYSAGVLYSSDSDVLGTSGTILEVLLTAAFMNAAVKQHYETGWETDHAAEESRVSLSTYTMNVDSEHVPQWGRMRLYPSLDPKDYSLDTLESEKWYTDERLFGGNNVGYGDTGQRTKQTIFEGLFKSWTQWKNGEDAQAVAADPGTVRISIKPIGGVQSDSDVSKKGSTPVQFGENKMTISNQDVLDNITYNEKFYDVSSADLSGTFESILSLITGQIFVPMTGDNDAGVSDSLTYQDPIGDYMEIKNQSITVPAPDDAENPEGTTYDMSMLLFGEMHGLVRTGIYDFQWNDQWMEAHNKLAGTEEFPKGWYRGSADTADRVESDPDTGAPSGQNYQSAEEAWQDGWVYRLGYKDLIDYVPISGADKDTTPEQLPAQIKSTTYTVYRFADKDEAQNELRINPVYGENVPEDLQEKWDAADEEDKRDNTLYKGIPGVYRLNDIRVWGEVYGDYVDTDGAITPNPSAYDASLYVNIPVAAVPTQLAEITLGPNGVLSYKTNLTEERQCTPVRLFYAVGLEEDLIIRDGSGKQTGVDISALSEEYVNTHRNSDNSIWFISNYYSNTTYGGYVESEGNYTRGDPTVTFSPSRDNRYYVFQKPRPVYAHAYRVQDESGTLAPVDASGEKENYWNTSKDGVTGNRTGGNSKTTWEDYGGGQEPASWAGGLFMGVYQNEADFKQRLSNPTIDDDTGKKMITDANGDKFEIVDGGLVFFESDLLDHVTSEENGKYTENSVAFNSEDYFFILLDYYLPDEGTTGEDLEGKELEGTSKAHAVQRVVTRKGSEFGSGLKTDKIGNGDMLCWTDMSGKISLTLAYHSYTETGDRTRGEPTYDKLLNESYSDENTMAEYLARECGLKNDQNAPSSVGDDGKTPAEREAVYWLDLREQLSTELAQAKETVHNQTDFEKYFRFAVAARPGGLRVGDMFQNRRLKTDPDKPDTPGGGNRTQTSYSYYIPTVSTESGVDDKVIINNYLGNNGRLAVANQNVLVTKMLTPPEGFNLTEEQKGKAFNFQAYIQGMTGERSATRVFYNEYSQTWQRRIASIDVLTDNSGLLFDRNNQRALFDFEDGEDAQARQVVEENGAYFYANADGTADTSRKFEKNPQDLYYLYLPGNEDGMQGQAGDQNARRIYTDDYDTDPVELKNSGVTTYYPAGGSAPSEGFGDYSEATEDCPAGTHEYWVSDAELIPVSAVSDAESTGETEKKTWEHGESDAASINLDKFIVVVNKPTRETSANDIITAFSTRTTYMTQMLTFGQNANEDGDNNENGDNKKGQTLTSGDLYDEIRPESDRPDFKLVDNDQIARNTAEFTLKSGEGLLFTGLQDDRNYRFTEKLTSSDMAAGYTLKEAIHAQQYGSWNTYRPGANSFSDLGHGFESSGSEPFYHTNAQLWESFATFKGGSSDSHLAERGNHHEPAGNSGDGSVSANPSCVEDTADQNQTDGSVRHYFVRDGELIDKHYSGEDFAFNNNRYVVGATAHFLVNGETQDSASAVLPVEPKSDYAGAYSLFGDTGNFEEQAHFVNTYDASGISIIKKLEAEDGTVLNEKDLNTEFEFTLKLTQAENADIPVPLPLKYVISGENGEVVKGRLVAYEASPAEDKDIPADDENNTTWHFKLRADQIMRVEGLPLQTGYTFTITETHAPGFTSDGDSQSEGGQNKFEGTVSPENAEGPVQVTFVNTKKAGEPVGIVQPINKSLTSAIGDSAGDTERTFSFRVLPFDGNPESDPWKDGQTVIGHMSGNDGNGIGNIFGEDPDHLFKQAGTYRYTVTEQISTAPGVSTDGRIYNVTVEVIEEYDDNEVYTGKLSAIVSITEIGNPANSPGELTFGNIYNPKEISVPLRARKIFENGQLSSSQFRFELEGVNAQYAEPEPAPDTDESAGEEKILSIEEIPEGEEPDAEQETPENEEPDAEEETPDSVEPDVEEETPDSEETDAEEETPDSKEPDSEEETPDSEETNAEEETPESEETDAEGETPDSVEPDVEVPPMPVPPPVDPPKPDGNKVQQWNDESGWVNFGSVTFKKAGTYTYIMREIPGEDWGIEYSTTEYTVIIVISGEGNADSPLSVESITYSPEIGSEEVPKFVNIRNTGDLKVTKTVTGSAGEKEKEWHFTVELSDATINGTYGDMTFVNGVAEFTLKHGESKTATGLPPGITYTVTEVEANDDSYATTVTVVDGSTGVVDDHGRAVEDAKGSIEAGETDEVEFVNDKPEPPDTPPDDTPPDDTTPDTPSDDTPPDTPDTSDTPPDTYDTPADTPDDTPLDTPADTPDDTPSETPADTPDDTPSETLTDTSDDTSSTVPPGTPPNQPPSDDAPRTGDDSHPELWMMLMACSFSAVVVILGFSASERRKRSRRRRRKS